MNSVLFCFVLNFLFQLIFFNSKLALYEGVEWFPLGEREIGNGAVLVGNFSLIFLSLKSDKGRHCVKFLYLLDCIFLLGKTSEQSVNLVFVRGY